jgi:2-dehydropantoate 2-reductase
VLPSNPSFAIVGSGAIGSYYGGRLAQSGLPVHFLLRSDYDHVRAHGLKITSIAGDFHLAPSHLNIYRSTADMPKVDIVLVTLKSTDNPALADLIPPLLHESTAIITLQNGLGNEDHLASLFGAHRIIGGVAFTCINRLSPGVISHTDHGHIHLSDWYLAPREHTGGARSAASPTPNQQDPSRAILLAHLFTQSRIPTTPVDNILFTRWSKLTWNIPFNGLTTILDVPTDQLIATPEAIHLIEQIIQEIIQTAAATGIHLPPDIAARQIRLTQSMGPYLTSTQLDRRHRRPLELESLFLKPLAVARLHEIPVPRLQMLSYLLESINNATSKRTS